MGKRSNQLILGGLALVAAFCIAPTRADAFGQLAGAVSVTGRRAAGVAGKRAVRRAWGATGRTTFGHGRRLRPPMRAGSAAGGFLSGRLSLESGGQEPGEVDRGQRQDRDDKRPGAEKPPRRPAAPGSVVPRGQIDDELRIDRGALDKLFE